MKRYVTLVHFNKPGSKWGTPWTVHYRGQCIRTPKVTIEAPVETIFMPNKKTNPRAWLRCLGVVDIDDNGEVTIR